MTRPTPASIPTLAELNDLPAEHTILLMLRVLSTSDLTFMYVLFEPSTIADICNVSGQMLAHPELELTEEESSEAREYLKDMYAYLQSIGEMGEGRY
jgi:hypothetical protein